MQVVDLLLQDAFAHCTLNWSVAACAYICTEDVFPHRRLMQLAKGFAEEHKCLGHSAKSYTDKVMLAHCATVVSEWVARGTAHTIGEF